MLHSIIHVKVIEAMFEVHACALVKRLQINFQVIFGLAEVFPTNVVTR